MNKQVLELCQTAKKASYNIADKDRNAMLAAIADYLVKYSGEILDANKKDLDTYTNDNASYRERMTLNKKRIEDIAEGVRQVIALSDPLGEVIGEWTAPKGFRVKKVSVPLGVVGIIYESRPNITVDTAALCLKSGNAVVLRGSRDTLKSNEAIVKVMKKALKDKGFPAEAIQIITDGSREAAEDFMRCSDYVDVLIPRGGAGLIKTVMEKSNIPVIQSGTGNCHIYIEKTADEKMAIDIVVNAKVSRPSVCNAAESLLIDKSIADKVLPKVLRALAEKSVEIRGDSFVRKIFAEAKEATDEDYYTEYNALIIAVKVVEGINEAIEHINKYGSQHSEAIITADNEAAAAFLKGVDAAAVYQNVSTRFTDGFEFGFGAEIAISTQKLHARGPMGLKELTSYKYIAQGKGEVRG
jgi:glutamate-5-semialdehyde dehydrogenase